MPNRIVAHGSQWSRDELYDGWGDDTPDEMATKLGDLVLARFHNAAPSAYWAPSTAEVTGSVDSGLDLDPDELDALRQGITQKVWDEFINEKLTL